MRLIEEHRLSQHRFMVDDELSIADIMAYEEVVQLRHWDCLLDGVSMESFKQFPNIHGWMDRMGALEGHDDTHRIMEKLTPWVKDRLVEYESLHSRVDSLMREA